MRNKYSKILRKLLLEPKKGFSIGEVLLAAFIMVVALTAIVNVVASSMNHSMDSRNYIIASELAQEGAELVRNLRDNNLVNEKTLFDGFPSALSDCQIDKDANLSCGSSSSSSYSATPATIYSCPNGGTLSGTACNVSSSSNDFKLKYNNKNFYVHGGSGSKETKFSRKIVVNDYNNIGRRIYSIVSWGSAVPPSSPANCNLKDKCAYVESILLDN